MLNVLKKAVFILIKVRPMWTTLGKKMCNSCLICRKKRRSVCQVQVKCQLYSLLTSGVSPPVVSGAHFRLVVPEATRDISCTIDKPKGSNRNPGSRLQMHKERIVCWYLTRCFWWNKLANLQFFQSLTDVKITASSNFTICAVCCLVCWTGVWVRFGFICSVNESWASSS